MLENDASINEEHDMRMNLLRKTAALTAAPAFVLGFALLTSGAEAADFTTELAASEGAGLPEGHTSEQWLKAQGQATATAEGQGSELT